MKIHNNQFFSPKNSRKFPQIQSSFLTQQIPTPPNSPQTSPPKKTFRFLLFCLFTPQKKRIQQFWHPETTRNSETEKKNAKSSVFFRLLQLGDFGVQVRVLLLHLLHLARNVCTGFGHFFWKTGECFTKN